MHPARRDGRIAIAQAGEHSGFFLAGHQPENAPGAIENWVGQGHPAVPLVDPCYRNVCIPDVQHRIAGHERSGVSVGAEPQVNEVQHRRRTGKALQRMGVLNGCGIEIEFLHRHRMDAIPRHCGMLQQAFVQMREVSAGIARGRGALVDLEDMNPIPGHILACQRAKHQPRRVPATECGSERPALCNGIPGQGGGDTGSSDRGTIGIGKDFDLHGSTYSWGFSRWPPNS